MHKCVRFVAEAVVTLLLLAPTHQVFAKPIDLTNRTVPFAVTADNVVSGTSTGIPTAPDLHAHVTLSPRDAKRVYAILAAPREQVSLQINGRNIDIQPLPRQDGLLFLVDPMYLCVGQNHLSFVRPTGASLPWAGTMMFSLDGTNEEAHFGEAFADDEQLTKKTIEKQLPIDSRMNNYDVLSYDCTWKPDMFSPQLLAGTQVTVRAKAVINSFSQVVLDFDMNVGGNLGTGDNGAPSGMVVTTVDQGPATSNLVFSTDTVNNLLIVDLPAPIAANTEFTVRVNYSGYPNDNFPKQIFGSDAYAASTHSGFPVVYSASQPYGARRWWPCKDTPADKATTSIQRIIVPNNLGFGLTAVSNGKLQSVINNGDGTDTHLWVNSYPIATYLFSIAVSNYILTQTTYTALDNVTTMPLGHFIYSENFGIEGNGAVGTLDVMNFFRDKFGEYPFLSEKYQTATWNITFAIEHQTCTSMPAGSTVGVGNGKTRRNIHELAHHWFGDKVTCQNWDHVWLNEGFATYCEALATEEFGALTGATEDTYHEYVNSWGVTTNTPVVNGNGDDFAGSVVYRKGAWVLHMLRRVLGDDDFFQALRDYAAQGYTTALSQTAGPVSFQAVCENAAGLAPGALQQFFTQWLTGYNGSGFVYFERPRYGGHGALTSGTVNQVSLAITQTQLGSMYHMPIDVQFTDANNNKWIAVAQNSTSSGTVSINSGTSYPIEFDFDPNNWILNSSALTLHTIGLPPGQPSIAYSHTLRGSSGTAPRTFTLRAGAPAWLSLSTAGVLTGTPPAAGTYIVPVRLADNVGAILDSNLELHVLAGTPPPPVPVGLVINEIFYENYSAPSDVGEFVEIYNSTVAPIDISNFDVVFVGVAGTSYLTVTIPTTTILAAGDYYVIGNATTIHAVYPGVVDLNVNLDNNVSDSAPGAVVLHDTVGQRVDSIAYRADTPMTAGAMFADATAEGGVGRSTSRALGTTGSSTIGRLPNGIDTGSNLRDFEFIVPSPGSANSGGVTLPFTDNFDSGANPAWHFGFVAPVRTAALGSANKPPTDIAAGVTGNALEVMDSTGGGDVNFLPGAFNQINFTGHLWIPQTVAANTGWSTGVGIATRSEAAWFQNTVNGSVENGFYLEYQNASLGSNGPLENGAVASHAGTIKLFAVNGLPSLNTGPGASIVTELGSATPAPSTWTGFRLVFDVPNNKLYAAINDTTVLYDGIIPAGTYNTSGGVTIGFREQHSGNPSAANVEATWVDNIAVNTNTTVSAGISHFELY